MGIEANTPKCCATCRHCQRRTKYCHKHKEVRFDLMADFKCDDWAKRWKTVSRETATG